MKEPSRPTRKRLFAVSGNQCAYPGCKLPLVDSESGVVTGEICHIHGRRRPRHDPDLSDEEVHGFENLIVLCPIHHLIVDAPESKVTAEDLRAMKSEHERQNAGGRDAPESMESKIFSDFVRRVHEALTHSEPPVGNGLFAPQVQEENIEELPGLRFYALVQHRSVYVADRLVSDAQWEAMGVELNGELVARCQQDESRKVSITPRAVEKRLIKLGERLEKRGANLIVRFPTVGELREAVDMADAGRADFVNLLSAWEQICMESGSKRLTFGGHLSVDATQGLPVGPDQARPRAGFRPVLEIQRT